MAARANMYVVLRAQTSPQYLIPLVRQKVADLDRGLPVAALRPMNEYVLAARTQSRFVAVLFASLAAVALLLSSIGIYGVTANAVTRRTREIGIRMALGARFSHIVGLVSNTGLRPVLTGACVGLGLSFGLTPLLATLLFGVHPVSAPVLVAVFGGLSAIGLLAILIPTARVLRSNPMSALRTE
jgi:ABC-type antimicrobial peptide transport system permease subunit